ncbi:MAG: bifunctional 3,4-dihydroxy-2-butanone-4-phosphate synthase/GTP cyclohydrolase II [bacterium]|nr:bifunctional 3,4-dihydroxy-2-butanone-4-phosphate synthase/GTP cyclohydrolase II [bacterium]
MSPSSIPEILEDLSQGRMIILVDDPDRENEGDIAMLAEHCTPEAINFMIREARGLICMPMSGTLCDRLRLEAQTPRNTSKMGTAFTVSIEAATGVTTGISAADRARTIQVACDPNAEPDDLARPGHIFPLRAKDGGVLVRGGQTEGIVDLARLAGGREAGAICEIMNDDGTMARMPHLESFAEKHGLKICTISDLIAYRRRNERLVEPVELDLPLVTDHGPFSMQLFRSTIDGKEHVALTKGMPEGAQAEGARPGVEKPVFVRVHSECLTGDVFGSQRCDCGPQLEKAMKILAAQEHGVLVYLRQEGRGIGLANKLKAYRLQDEGLDTVEANQALGLPVDLREYGIGAQILHYLGVRQMRLLTNNPKKIHGVAGYGLDVVDQLPLETEPKPTNIHYLRTKRDKLGHTLTGCETLNPGS